MKNKHGHFRTFHNKLLNLGTRLFFGLISLHLLPALLCAQDSTITRQGTSIQAKQSLPLFSSQELLPLTITINSTALWDDRGADPKYHSGQLELIENGTKLQLPVKLKSRGHFRRSKNVCRYAPLLLNLSDSIPLETTVFAGQDKLKLVTPCIDEELVEREYLIYRVYNLLSPLSLQVRRVKILVIDSARPARKDNIYGFLLEPPRQAAARNGLQISETKGVHPQFLLPSEFSEMAVFEFFIANTDWSVQYLHNIELAGNVPGAPYAPIAYDFDHAGLVNAPYALPAAELDMESVKERRYRGYCPKSMESFQLVFARFNAIRQEIEALYQTNTRLTNSYKKWALEYIDKFYETINNPKRAESAFTYPCRPGGTGGVIIRGLAN